jgi:hypothetical protein
MPKSSEVATLVLGVVAAAIGYLMVDQSAARTVTDWLRQEIRKEVPDYKRVGHPNYNPVVPNQGL